MRNRVPYPARASLFVLIVLVAGATFGTLIGPAWGKTAGDITEQNDWDLYMNRMARIAGENLSPVFQAVTRAANSFEQNENMKEFSQQLENTKIELMTIQALMSSLNPPVQLLVADHYIRSGVQKLLNGMDILLNGMAGEDAEPPVTAMESVSLGAGYVVKGYGMLNAQNRAPTDLAQTP